MSAPSFSSFPSSFTSFPDLEPGPSKRPSTPGEQPTATNKREEIRRDKKDKERREKKHRLYKEHRDILDRHTSRKHEDVAYLGLDDERVKAKEDSSIRAEKPYASATDKEQLPYYTDRKGDPLNVQYGGLHAGSIPRYHLVSGGKTILGLEHGWRVVHRGRKGIEVAVGGKRRMPGLTDSSARHLLHAVPTRTLLASSQDKYKYDEVEGFLRITSGHQRKGDPSYRSITASKHDAYSDEDTGSSNEDRSEISDSDSDTTPMTSLQATLKSLEEQLSADPTSISIWLSLLSHTLSTVPITSKNAPKARSEITLSILRRALSAHPQNASSKALRLRYLKAGEESWHERKLREEWEDALKVGGIEMWIEWLDWRIRKADNGMDGVVDDAKRVLAAVHGDEIGMLRVQWRMAVGFRDAGYIERANALFQAEAELIYRTSPELAHQPFEKRLDALEEFWDSEAPRIGEASARAERYWNASVLGDVANLSQPRKAAALPTDRDPYRHWAASEVLCDRAYQLPTRSFDEAAEADPYATILFSDLRPLLVDLRSTEARDALRHIWLAFLGLHVPGYLSMLTPTTQDCTDDRWAYAHLASPSHLSSVMPSEADNAARRITADAQAGVLIGREREYSSAFGPVKNWGYGVVGSLEAIPGTRWTMWGPQDVTDVNADLVREVFAQCRTGDDTEWDILSLAFEGACNLKGAAVQSKKLLASAQDSIPLWAAHARLQRLRGRLDDARKVYQTVLASSKPGSTDCQLWWDWAEMEWLAGRSDSATEVILRSTGSQGTGGIAVLRAKRHLQEATSIPSIHWKSREYSIKLWALLEILTTSPEAALATLDVQLSALEFGSTAHESLAVVSLSLLYVHGIVLRHPMPPALLRERAERVIELYPSNTIVLGMFLEAQKGQAIWGRVKALFGEGIDAGMREKDLCRRVAEVWVASWEKGRWEAEQERTRGGLSAAVQSERTRGSAALWLLYVHFEVRTGNMQRAKKLLFRAVGECPLAKELYLLAFGPLRRVFKSRELNEWAETMAERGIRMRRGLDELLEGWTEEAEDNRAEASDTEDGDEIEHNARELRRLMPY